MTREKILEAAFELLSKGHYSSVTLSQIAEKVSKKTSIYSHFVSKEALFLELLNNEIHYDCSKIHTSVIRTERLK